MDPAAGTQAEQAPTGEALEEQALPPEESEASLIPARAEDHEDSETEAAPPETPLILAIEGHVVTLSLSRGSSTRLEQAFGCEITEDLQRANDAALIVVSTRCPRARSLPTVRELRSSGRPIGIVCHTGGEQVALEIMRGGGTAVVAEGNEAALRRLVESDDASSDESLVHTYEQRIGSNRDDEASNSSVDKVTGLPGPASFEGRLHELTQSGSLARVGYARVGNFTEAVAEIDSRGLEVLRRRLSIHFRDLASRLNVELFNLGPDGFAFVGRDLSSDEAYALGKSLADVTEAFAPGGTAPLTLAVGHAGPEISTDISFLRELAERALEDARGREGSAVVNAEDLSSSLASTTELDMALKLVSYLNDFDGYPGSHSSRVADYASELGRQLGLEGRDLSRVRLAALLHDIGKVGLPPEAVQFSETLEGSSLDSYRSHPERGARYLVLNAGKDVAEAVRSHHESWDGGGFPHGLKGDEIPMAARIIAVVDSFDAYTSQVSDTGVTPSRTEALALIKERAGTHFDPLVVEVANNTFSYAESPPSKPVARRRSSLPPP